MQYRCFPSLVSIYVIFMITHDLVERLLQVICLYGTFTQREVVQLSLFRANVYSQTNAHPYEYLHNFGVIAKLLVSALSDGNLHKSQLVMVD